MSYTTEISHLRTSTGAFAAAARANAPPPERVLIENVVRTFGETAALHGVSLEVRAGELLALLGPSGSGKTTLLRILAGLDAPDRGRVLFGDLDANRLSARERHVGFVFQSYALFRNMTVGENIAFGLSVRPRKLRPSRPHIRARVRELLELVQLEGLEARFPSQLSGGQKQRVALARALAIEPRLLLLDEPFGALDAKVRKDLRRWLRDLHRRTGHTTVFVTHDQDEALELAERVAILNKGRIVQTGSPDQVMENPASLFVYEFVGEANSTPVVIREGRVWAAGESLGLASDGLPDGPAVLAFRPNDVVAVDPDRPGLTCRVEAVMRQTREKRLALRTRDFVIDAATPAGLAAREGETIRIAPTRYRLYPVSAADR